jgi:hypothetical protein
VYGMQYRVISSYENKNKTLLAIKKNQELTFNYKN